MTRPITWTIEIQFTRTRTTRARVLTGTSTGLRGWGRVGTQQIPRCRALARRSPPLGHWLTCRTTCWTRLPTGSSPGKGERSGSPTDRGGIAVLDASNDHDRDRAVVQHVVDGGPEEPGPDRSRPLDPITSRSPSRRLSRMADGALPSTS